MAQPAWRCNVSVADSSSAAFWSTFSVVKAIGSWRRLRKEPGVVIQEIIKVNLVPGEALHPIWILPHVVEGQGIDKQSIGCVEIHVLLVPVSMKEVITLPTLRQWRETYRIERKLNFVSTAKDH